MKDKIQKKEKNKISAIKLLLLDVDGVLTSGSINIFDDGSEFYSFNVYDGFGLGLWHKAGFKVGLITGRSSKAVILRAQSLKVDFILQGVGNKVFSCLDLIKKEGFDISEVAFVGDDFQDLSLLKNVGFSMAPANAREEIKKVVDYVSKFYGGGGAVRDCVEFLLKKKGIWKKIIQNEMSLENSQ